jgi:WD40 repeat protein
VTGISESSQVEPTAPYVGLRPFQYEDSRLFFGRRQQINTLLDLLHRHRFLPVVGSSGCGKSSLIRAGLVPALQAGFLVQDRDRWDIATLTPGDAPVWRLVAEILAACTEGHSSEETKALFTSIEETGEDVLVGWLEKRLGDRRNLLLCVDQFEEIFAFRNVGRAIEEEGVSDRAQETPPPITATARRSEAEQFVALLLELARRPNLPVYVLLTMRSDFLGDCDVFRGLPEAMNEARYLVPRLTREQLGQAIEGPARLANAAIAPRLLDRMLNDVGDRADQLPVLQHALLRTWRRWRLRDREGNGPIQPVDFEEAGTLDRALSADADAALREVDTSLAERVFRCLTDTDARKRRVRRAATVAELEAVTKSTLPEIAKTLDAFRAEERHFLTLSGRPSDLETRVIITHESLIRRWETLQRWVDEERDARDALCDYARRAHQWKLGAGTRLTGVDLVLARRWRANAKPNPPWAARYVTQADLASVLSYIDESGRAERWRVWSLRVGIVAVILALATLALTLRVKVVQERTERGVADVQRHAAVAAKTDAENASQRSGDLAKLFVASRATDKAEAAALLRDVTDTRIPGWSEIASAVLTHRSREESRVPVGTEVWAVAVSPDGRRIASGLEDGDIRVLSVDGNGQPVVLKGHELAVWSVAFSPDGRHVVSGSKDTSVRVWNADGSGQPLVLGGHGDAVWSVAFSPDGRQVASGSEDKVIRIWNADGSGQPVVLKGHQNAVSSVAFSPDGRHIVSGSPDTTVRVWSADGSGAPLVLKGHEMEVWSVAFSPDGRHVVSGSKDTTVRVWNADGTGQPVVLGGHGGDQVWSVGFGPEGRQVVSGSQDKAIRIWNADGSGQPLVLAGHENAVTSVAFSPDGQHIVSGSEDRTVRVWNADQSGPVVAFKIDGGGIYSLALSPDGQHIAAAFEDNAIRIWNANGRERPLVLKGHEKAVYSVVFSSDGRHIVTGSEDKTVRVWNVDGTGRPLVLKGHEMTVGGVAVSPDGQHIASGSDDKTVRVWNADGSGQSATVRTDSAVHCVAFSADGRQIVSGFDDHSVRVWNADGGGQPLVLKGHERLVWSVAFSPDGRHIASGSQDGTVRVWSADGSGQPVVLKGHEMSVRSVAFSPDGRYVVSGSEDHTARVWNADGTGQAVVLGGNEGEVMSVAFSSDGLHVVSGSLDGNVRVFPATLDLLRQTLWASGARCLPPVRRQELLFETADDANRAHQLCTASASRAR